MVEAASSSLVTRTKKPSSFVQNAQIRRLFLIKNDLFLLLLHNRIGFASKPEICLAFFLRIFYEFIPEFSPNALRKASEYASFLAFFHGLSREIFIALLPTSAPYTEISLRSRSVLCWAPSGGNILLGNSWFLKSGYVSFRAFFARAEDSNGNKWYNSVAYDKIDDTIKKMETSINALVEARYQEEKLNYEIANGYRQPVKKLLI